MSSNSTFPFPLPPGVSLPSNEPLTATTVRLLIQVFLATQDFLDLVKLEHVLAGIYIWEYFTTLDVEWECYRSAKKSLATIWIYSLCKLSALAYTITNLVGYNVTTYIDCKPWLIARYTFATLSIMCAAAIVVIRLGVVWEKDIIVLFSAIATALVLAAFWLRQSVIVASQAIFVPDLGCQYVASTNERPLSIVIVVSSFIFLVLLTVGLGRRGVFGRKDWWRAVYVEGIVWLALATTFGISDVVLLYENRNGAWNQMLRSPEFFLIIIGATRLYSTLSRSQSFAVYRESVSISSGKPTLDGLNIRTGGVNSNSVFAVAPLGTVDSGLGIHDGKEASIGHGESTTKASHFEDVTVDIEAGAVRSVQFVQPENVLYIGREKAEHPVPPSL